MYSFWCSEEKLKIIYKIVQRSEHRSSQTSKTSIKMNYFKKQSCSFHDAGAHCSVSTHTHTSNH